MGRPVKSINKMTRKVSKFEKETRANLEETIVKRGNSKPKPWFPMNEKELEIFNNLVKLNDYFADADGISLSMLTKSLYRYELYSKKILELDIDDERCKRIEKNRRMAEQSIIQHMTMLCIPLSQRLRLSNDLSRLKVEQKKLEQMEDDNIQPENPLLALLR